MVKHVVLYVLQSYFNQISKHQIQLCVFQIYQITSSKLFCQFVINFRIFIPKMNQVNCYSKSF